VLKVPKSMKIVQGVTGFLPQGTYYVPTKGVIVHKQQECYTFIAKTCCLF